MDKKKMIGDIVTSITDKELKKDYFYNAVPLAVILGKDAKEGTLWAAFASYAPGCKMIEVAAICDNTILGSGKKGILFSTEGIYGSMFNKNRKQGPIAMPIKYEELDSARPSPRDKSEVELVFKGGRVEKIYVYTYTGFVITALNRILEELKREKEREKEESKEEKDTKADHKKSYNRISGDHFASMCSNCWNVGTWKRLIIWRQDEDVKERRWRKSPESGRFGYLQWT